MSVNWKIAPNLTALVNCIECDFIILEDEDTGETSLYDGVLKKQLMKMGNFETVTQTKLPLIERNAYTMYYFTQQCTDSDSTVYNVGMYTYNTTTNKFVRQGGHTALELNETLSAGETSKTIELPANTKYLSSYCKNGNKLLPVETTLIEPTDTEKGSITFDLYEAQDFDISIKVVYAG